MGGLYVRSHMACVRAHDGLHLPEPHKDMACEQCSTGVQDAQVRVVLMVTVGGNRVFPKARGEVGKGFCDQLAKERGSISDGPRDLGTARTE